MIANAEYLSFKDRSELLKRFSGIFVQHIFQIGDFDRLLVGEKLLEIGDRHQRVSTAGPAWIIRSRLFPYAWVIIATCFPFFFPYKLSFASALVKLKVNRQM